MKFIAYKFLEMHEYVLKLSRVRGSIIWSYYNFIINSRIAPLLHVGSEIFRRA